jgi:hypothetical protein
MVGFPPLRSFKDMSRQYFVHVRPEWGPRWLVIWVSRVPRSWLDSPPITYVARVEVPPPPPAPER